MDINPYELPSPQRAPPCSGRLPVRVKGVLVADDAICAMKTLGMGRWWRWISVLFGGLGVVTGLLLGTIFRNETSGILVGITSVIWIVDSLCRSQRELRKAWDGHAAYKNPLTWTFSDDCLFVESIHSEERYDWKDIIDSRLTCQQVVLVGRHQRGSVLVFIPRRFFEMDEDWAAVGQLLAAKLPVRGV